MPRPKRTKVAPSRPAPRVQKTSKPVAETLPHESEDKSDGRDNISDSDDKVTSASKGKSKGKEFAVARRVSRGRARANEGHDAGESEESLPMMTGALGIPSEETLLADMDLESSSPSVELGRRDTSTTMVENSTLAIGNFKRRPRPQSILGRRTARARSSSIESNLAENDGLTTVRKRPTSTSNNAPDRMGGRVRSSSSGLEMDRNDSAVPGSALRIGNFKRRARAPSVLGTGQKPRAPRPDYDLEDEDDFSPDDQSTPLNLSKSKATTGSSGGSASSRKRKLSAIQVPRSQESPEPEEPESPALPSQQQVLDIDETIPSTVPLDEDGAEEEPDDEDEDGPEDRSRSPSQELPPLSDARHLTPEPLSSTMAPPESSSPAPESPPPPRSIGRPQPQQAQTRSGRPMRSKTPLPLNQDSPPSSPPSLTHSPNGPAARTAPRVKNQAPPISTRSTAELQALLPRRRRHATRDPFDIPSEDELDVSGLASDEDELTHSTMRPVSRRSMAPLIRKPTKLKAAAKGKRLTYGRAASRAASDKENDNEADPNDSLGPLPDDAAEEDGEASMESSQALEKRVGKELKNAARKFQEVDKWELDFEECTASSSSQTDAR